MIALAGAHQATAQNNDHIRVAIVGLVHGHVQGFLRALPSHTNVELVGISDPDASLRQKYQAQTKLPEAMFFADEATMLKTVKPQAILVYTSILDHRKTIDIAAPMHVAVMVEKPLATTVEDAEAIQALAQKYDIPVLTNYETTWYASNTVAYAMLRDGKIGDLRKLVVHDGHRGPKEIGVQPEFFRWLTDPTQNGAGALFDFGCYGADLATWFLHGELPESVTAITLQLKPDIYPNVDDDATILLKYPHAQAILQGSWNWPFDRKDMEVYGATGYINTVKGDMIRVRLAGEQNEKLETAPALTSPEDSSLDYLTAVLTHKIDPKGDLSSLDTNVKVVRILAAARESAKTGRTVMLSPAKK